MDLGRDALPRRDDPAGRPDLSLLADQEKPGGQGDDAQQADSEGLYDASSVRDDTIPPIVRSVPPAVLDAAGAGDPVALTRALVATPSVNPALEPGGSGEAAAARLAADWLEAWGFSVEMPEVAPGRPNVVARLGGGSPTLLLNGHLDTVGVEGMTVPPFGAEPSDDRLLGRGSADMKGGLGALLAAGCGVARGGGPERGELIVALTCDEEHASLGMQALVGSDVRADAAVVCEPTELTVMPAHKGFHWIDLTFRGRAAHGSRPEEGRDGIRSAGRCLAALDRLEARFAEGLAHPLLGRATVHAGTIQGGSAPSVYPELCTLVLELRVLPGTSAEDSLEAVRDLVRSMETGEGVDVSIESALFRPGTEVEASSPLVRGLLGALEAEGRPGRVRGMSAWVDAAFLNEAGVPAVCFGPGSIARAHSADEWVSLEEIRTAARILERFVRGYLGRDGREG